MDNEGEEDDRQGEENDEVALGEATAGVGRERLRERHRERNRLLRCARAAAKDLRVVRARCACKAQARRGSVEAVTDSSAYVVEAELALGDGFDPAAVGAAVTVELCGHWEHEGACRWPHNSAIDAQRDPARFRTLFVADESESAVVRERVEATLRRAAGWRVVSIRSRPVAKTERPLAERLLAGPRAAE